jgi:hypothetical protein
MRKGIMPRERRVARRAQRDVLTPLLLVAGRAGNWLTLRELVTMTGFGEASISAQLRHLRKPEFGGFRVEKRCRDVAEIVGRQAGPVWEYRMSYGARRGLVRRGVSNCAGRLARRVGGRRRWARDPGTGTAMPCPYRCGVFG